MKTKPTWAIASLVILLLLASSVIAQSEVLPIYVRPLDGGLIQPNRNFNYTFNFTNDTACTQVVLSTIKSISTDTYGIGFTQIDISGIQTTPKYLCEYKNNSLRKTHNISSGLFATISSSGNVTVEGVLSGGSPLRLADQGVAFRNGSGINHFSIYHAHGNISNVSSAFSDAIIFQTELIGNPNNMEVCFWDKENQKMFLCLNEGKVGRATTVRRSFQVVGNTTVKENDENYTLCEGANFVDCDTDATGADILVQDDIEAQSIYANENLTANEIHGKIIGNISYGGMKYSNSGFEINCSSSGIFFNIHNLSAGDLNGFTFSNNSLTVKTPGKYYTTLSGRYSDIKDNILDFSLFNNNIKDNDCFDTPEVLKAGKKEYFGFNCLLDLSESDNITLRLNSTLNGTTTIYKINLNLIRVGST